MLVLSLSVIHEGYVTKCVRRYVCIPALSHAGPQMHLSDCWDTDASELVTYVGPCKTAAACIWHS